MIQPKVEIVLPSSTFEKTKYKLLDELEVSGVKVPSGFITDGASVPRALWWLFPPVGRYFLAAVVHDYLLDTGHTWSVANRKFYEALKEQGVARWVSLTMYAAVSVHGWRKRVFRRIKQVYFSS